MGAPWGLMLAILEPLGGLVGASRGLMERKYAYKTRVNATISMFGHKNGQTSVSLAVKKTTIKHV